MAEEATPFISPTGIEWQGNTGTVQYGGGDRSMVVMFYNKAIHHAGKSLEAGRPVFEDRVYVRIHPPGERLNIIDRPADPSHRQRWPQQWAQFQQQKQQTPDGTPIDMLYPDQPSVAAMLRANGVHTVEACAELSAHAIENIGMGTQRYVNDADRYLKAANKGVGGAQFRKELADRDQQIKILTGQVESLKAQVDKMLRARLDAPTLADLNRIHQQNMGRPGHVLGESFDPQMEQLNATHGSAAIKKPGRQRARLRA